MFARLAVVSAALFLSLLVGTSARAEPVIWRVTDADTEMLLFGSVHMLPPHVEWRTDQLDAAIASADLVAFEILTPGTPEEEEAMYGPLLAYMFAVQPLETIITPATWARLESFLSERDIPVEGFNQLRPWAAAMMLEVAVSEDQGSADEFGVDTVLEASLAPGQRREALDTPTLLLASIQALAAYGDAEAETMLGQTLDWYEELEHQPDWSMEEAWAAGDMDSIASFVTDMKAEAPLLYDTLMTGRNVAWMPALKRMMDTETRVVVIAGAAHMAGPDGLPALLRAAGYKVEGP